MISCSSHILLIGLLKHNHGDNMISFDSVQAMLHNMSQFDIFYDNSKPFAAYLKKQGIDKILREENLLLRQKHTVVPHVRCFASSFSKYLVTKHLSSDYRHP